MTDTVANEQSDKKACSECYCWMLILGFVGFGIVVGTISKSGTAGFWAPFALVGLLAFIEIQVNKFVRKDA